MSSKRYPSRFESRAGFFASTRDECLSPRVRLSMNYTVHVILQARTLESVAIPFSRGSSQPRNRTQISCTAGFSLPAEPQGKPKNTGMGSLSLLQGIFLTQELNRGLLYCRQILYQLSYQGNYKLKFSFKKCDLQCLLHRFGVKSFTILSHIKY